MPKAGEEGAVGCDHALISYPPNGIVSWGRLIRMRNAFAPATPSLTYKLVLAICGLVLFCGILFWVFAMYLETKSAMTDILSFATSLSDLTKQSIRYDMLTAKRNDMQLTMENIVHSGSIEQVRIISVDRAVPFPTLPAYLF